MSLVLPHDYYMFLCKFDSSRFDEFKQKNKNKYFAVKTGRPIDDKLGYIEEIFALSTKKLIETLPAAMKSFPASANLQGLPEKKSQKIFHDTTNSFTPKGCELFATDGCCNYYGIVISGDKAGCVFYLDHDSKIYWDADYLDESAKKKWQTAIHVSDGFNEFLSFIEIETEIEEKIVS